MQLNKLHTMLLFIVCAALAACTDEVSSILSPDNGKTPIELSVGGVDAPSTAVTRAVITDGTNKTMQNFDTNTKIFMIMKSEYSALPAPYEALNYGGVQTTKYTVSRGDVTAGSNAIVFDDKNQKYWDDAHARSTKLNIWAYAQKGMSWTSCSFGEDKVGGGYQSSSPAFDTSARIEWRTAPIYPMIFNWKASHLTGGDANKQNQTTVMCQDLLFSNNLVNNSSTGTDIGGADARLGFNTSNRKFPQEGEALMKFYHAMSKITIKIIEGEGFNTSSTADFQFKSGTNVKLTGFNTEGLFSIQMGGFQQINNHAEIPSVYLNAPSPTVAPYYTLEALAVPNIDDFMQTYVPAQHDEFSRFVSGKKDLATDVMMEFTIDNNKYQVTSGQLYDALHEGGVPTGALVANATKKDNNGTYIPLEAGKNYVFTFNVGKTKIKDITAQVAQWENVEAEEFNPSNARITLNLEERGTNLTNSDHFSFYRAAKDNTGAINDDYTTYDWKTGYNTAGVTPTYVSTPTAHWTTDWYWDSNLNFYHFRALAQDNGSTKVVAPNSVVTDAGNGDYYALSHGETYTDILWGAPMKDVEPGNETSDAATLKWNYGPTTNGFDGLDTKATDAHQIYKAIGPTRDAVKLILFHMMSNVTFNIKTTTGADKVELGNGSGVNVTKIELQKVHTSGKILMGNGLVLGTTNDVANSNYTFTATPAPNGSGVVSWPNYGAIPQDLTNVVLVITTPDHNQYKVAMAEVLAAASNAISTNNIANPYSTVQSGTNAGKYIIDRWYPGFKYNYSFTLAKTGITNLQATIVDWENVSADNETVKIQ